MHFWERGTRGRVLRTSTSYPEKPVVQPRWFGTRWLSPLEPYPFGGPGKHSRHFQIRLRHWYRRSSSAAESSSPEAPAHPPMQRSTSGRREECQGYCWYAPFRGPSTFHWQLNWFAERKRSDGPLRVCHHCNPQTSHATAWSRPHLSASRTRTRSRRRQQLRPFVEVTEPGRNSEMSIHSEKMTHPQTSACLLPIVTITQCQATTASRNARVTRCLKQDPTRLYKDATSSLPDATSPLKDAPVNALLGKKLF